MDEKNQFQILHISDLHIDAKKDFDRSVVLDPLIKRVKKDRFEIKLKPEIVVVTGDIAYQGLEEEYDLAQVFFTNLLESLDLDDDKIFIVPGNHDLKRDVYPKAFVPKFETMLELNDEFCNKDCRDSMLNGHKNYFNFIKNHYPHMQSLYDNVVPFVCSYKTECGKKIGLLGLNSAWMSRETPVDEYRIAIGEFQIKKGMDALNSYGKHDCRICLFHHPLNFLWDKDKKICRSYFNDFILLSGHLHDAGGGFTEDTDGKIYQFQAGASYSNSEFPNRFQYITLNWDKNIVLRDFRKFNNENGKREWIVDNEICEKGSNSLPMTGSRQINLKQPDKKTDQPIKQQEEFKIYASRAVLEYQHLPTQGFGTNLRQHINLERVYINMRANIHAHNMDFNMEGFHKKKRREQLENLSSINIKTAFKAADHQKIKDMVILGDPGSGKTTLLKYILLMLITGKAEEKAGLDSKIIPFFAPLRELKDPDSETFDDFIKRVCWFKDYNITNDSFNELMHSGRAIILLDGLDEVANEKARIRTCAWIDGARKKYARSKFVITSRFAGYTEKSRLEGALFELSIQDFTIEEAQAFLEKWFETVEVALHPEGDRSEWKKKGRDQATALIEEIKKSKAIQKLAVNPLLLQIIALVRRDRRKKLPDRRVELYEECVDVLLEKWDMAKNIKNIDAPLTAKEARQVLQPLALWLHQTEGRRHAPMKQIIDIISGPLESIGKGDLDPEKMLLDIRDRSGLFMGYSETEYGFAHLGFQEYLAGVQIRNDGLVDLLVENYGDKWWKEVLLLSLALDSPSILEPFLEKIIPTPHFQSDIVLVMDAIRDSVVKPPEPFIEALKNPQLSSMARQNAAQALRHIGGKKAIQALKESVKDDDSEISTGAFQVLEKLGATNGIEKPVSDRAKFIHSKRGSDMVLIPAGVFLYGSREDDKNARSNEKPQRSIHLDDFYMDIHPVTNGQYSKFLNDAKPDKKILRKWINMGGIRVRIKQKGSGFLTEEGYWKHPATYVRWHGADAYAKWAGKRLPTEQEWEKAARGTEGQRYPWGDRFDKKRCNSKESGIGDTTPINSYPNGQSPYGCFDMAGNVWEWTESWYDNDKDYNVLRGGSWFDGSDFCLCGHRLSNHPVNRINDVGFRCGRT